MTTLPLVEGRAERDVVADHLWGTFGEAILARVSPDHAKVQSRGPSLLLEGIGTRDTGRMAHRHRHEPLPYVTVIVPTGGRSDELDVCLTSLRSLRYPSFDVLVVDSAPADGSTWDVVARHAAEDGKVGYTVETRPGSSVARNHGIARTAAEYVAFTDDDVVVEADWLDGLMEPFLDDPRVEATTGLVLPAELETPAQLCFEEFRGFGKGFEARRYDLELPDAGERLLYPYLGMIFGSGNSMAFRRSALEAIGRFDPALGAGSPARAGSDVDAFSHVVLRGGRLAYQPRAICWHRHRRDDAQLGRQIFNYGAGLTAILTKWCIRRPSLMLSMLRALPKVLRRTPNARPGRKPGFPKPLRRLEIRGYLLGPVLYLRSVLWARRLGLGARPR
jgi:GT2 family glycosyltransferase